MKKKLKNPYDWYRIMFLIEKRKVSLFENLNATKNYVEI